MERSRHFISNELCAAYILRRGTIRLLLALELGMNPDEIEFYYNDCGRPFVRHNSAPTIGVTSSGIFAIVALGELNFGIDLEEDRAIEAVAELAKRIYSDTEQKLMEEYCNRYKYSKSRAFLNVWTMKESYLKANGSGLSQLMNFSLCGPAISPSIARRLTQNHDQHWKFHLRWLREGFVLAVASAESNVQVEILSRDFDLLADNF
jgi:4'-phosphopantetheinyl transferase